MGHEPGETRGCQPLLLGVMPNRPDVRFVMHVEQEELDLCYPRSGSSARNISRTKAAWNPSEDPFSTDVVWPISVKANGMPFVERTMNSMPPATSETGLICRNSYLFPPTNPRAS